MSQFDKLMLSILSGTNDSNIKFVDLQKVLSALGFKVRIKGDHFIYTKDGVDEPKTIRGRIISAALQKML